MTKQFWIFRLNNEDFWIAHKGPAILTSNRKNLSWFKGTYEEARIHANAIERKYKIKLDVEEI